MNSIVIGFVNKNSQKAHEISKNNGWYNEPVPFHRFIALINTELGEAVQAMRYNEEDIAIVEEIADCFIRVMDMVGYYGLVLKPCKYTKSIRGCAKPAEFTEKVSWTIFALANVWKDELPNKLTNCNGYKYDKINSHSISVLAVCIAECAKSFVDLDDFFDIVNRVTERNKKRGYKHGGRAF